MIHETGWVNISRSMFAFAKHLRIKMSSIPKSNGSVGNDILNESPGITSESGNESGVKNTTRNKRVSKAKTASITMKKINGNTLITIDFFSTRKNIFSKINTTEIR
jgi:hypothetical protein